MNTNGTPSSAASSIQVPASLGASSSDSSTTSSPPNNMALAVALPALQGNGLVPTVPGPGNQAIGFTQQDWNNLYSNPIVPQLVLESYNSGYMSRQAEVQRAYMENQYGALLAERAEKEEVLKANTELRSQLDKANKRADSLEQEFKAELEKTKTELENERQKVKDLEETLENTRAELTRAQEVAETAKASHEATQKDLDEQIAKLHGDLRESHEIAENLRNELQVAKDLVQEHVNEPHHFEQRMADPEFEYDAPDHNDREPDVDQVDENEMNLEEPDLGQLDDIEQDDDEDEQGDEDDTDGNESEFDTSDADPTDILKRIEHPCIKRLQEVLKNKEMLEQEEKRRHPRLRKDGTVNKLYTKPYKWQRICLFDELAQRDANGRQMVTGPPLPASLVDYARQRGEKMSNEEAKMWRDRIINEQKVQKEMGILIIGTQIKNANRKQVESSKRSRNDESDEEVMPTKKVRRGPSGKEDKDDGAGSSQD